MTRALGVSIKIIFWCAVVTVPLLGMWVASSLAVYHQQSLRAAIGVGLLAFPAAPLIWEAIAEARRLRRAPVKRHILTLGDRLLLRTLAVNLVFLGLLLASRPVEAFAAVSTRGDWMLDRRTGPKIEATRRGLFGLARGLEWLYSAAHQNPYRDYQPDPTSTSTPVPAPVPAPTSTATSTSTWPFPEQLHPAIAAMPAEAEASVESIAQYIQSKEPDPLQRAKAVHDYVADRIAYDVPSYLANKFPSQKPEDVLRTRTGVCAGYSLLFEAIAKKAGLDAVYVVGDARTAGFDEAGEGHAWNAIRLAPDAGWYLIDTTWDAGAVSGTEFKKRYRTSYFLAPPELFGIGHFPEEEKWQLRSPALTRGEFMRSPMRKPNFFTYGFELIAPDRAQVTVNGRLDIVIKNPQHAFVLADVRPHGAPPEGEAPIHCRIEGSAAIHASCTLPARGRYVVSMFANRAEYGSYDHVAEFAVNAD